MPTGLPVGMTTQYYMTVLKIIILLMRKKAISIIGSNDI